MRYENMNTIDDDKKNYYGPPGPPWLWGDERVDWDGINDAAHYLRNYLVRYGRVGVRDYKEKYGTVRLYCSLGWYQFHCITHPGYVFGRYPNWLWRLDCTYGSRIMGIINPVVIRYHMWLYRRAYSNAIKLFPHLTREILCAADYPELLKGLADEHTKSLSISGSETSTGGSTTDSREELE